MEGGVQNRPFLLTDSDPDEFDLDEYEDSQGGGGDPQTDDTQTDDTQTDDSSTVQANDHLENASMSSTYPDTDGVTYVAGQALIWKLTWTELSTAGQWW